jgi:4-hydroxybenzoate polyprenyltransferase
LAPDPSANRFGAKLKAFLTAVMGLLSILVFGLGCLRRSVLWLWIGFICALISGIFVQLLIDREKKRLAADRSGK